MAWIFLAIASHFCWALQNIADKYILENRIKNPYVYLIWFTMTGIISLILVPFIDLVLPSDRILLYLLIASAVYFFGGMPYVKAMQIEEPTRINVWWNLIPIFSLIIGWSFFDEKFTSIQLFAITILVFGAVIASLHAKGRKFIFSKAVWYMIVAGLCFATYGVLFHHIVEEMHFLSAFVFIHLFMAVFSLTLLFSNNIREDFIQEAKFKLLNSNLIFIILSITVIGHLGVLFNQWALSFASAALVFAMEGFQVIFVFIMAVLISVFAPQILKEELDRKNVVLKVVAIILMIIGIVILAFQ